MDSRYYNQNPQVTALLEKIEEQENEYDKLLDEYNENIDEYNKNVDDYNKLEDEVLHFNSLPWYKKMVYKFKL